MTDTVKKWYSEVGTKKMKMGKSFPKHFIQPCSMIACIGGTGSGKTNALIDFMHRKDGEFYDVILYTGSTSEEPLYEWLKSKLPTMRIFTDIKEFPDLTEFEDEAKDQQKLVILDDFVNLKPKEMSKLNKYFTSARKYGMSVWCMAQNYTSLPKIITRNLNYLIVFKLNDSVSVRTIVKNHDIHGQGLERITRAYHQATAEPRNFLLLDMKGSKEYSTRHNFLNML